MANEKEANAVFAKMLGMPAIPCLYAIFQPNEGFISGGYHYRKTSSTPRVFASTGAINRYLGGVAGSRYDMDHDLSQQERIPVEWMIVDLVTHEIWPAQEFYMAKKKKPAPKKGSSKSNPFGSKKK